MYGNQLTTELFDWQQKIESHAKEYGLNCFTQIYEILDWKQMNMVAAYMGFPNRYPHWRFGMEYEQLSKSYEYGLSKIYEMVINNDPCYAYLLHSNPIMDQKLVMAHVCGHNDFFKNNTFFSHTNRRMMDEMANHKSKVQRYINKYGFENVERFIDVCLSIDNLVDLYGPLIKRHNTSRDEVVKDEEVKLLKSSKSYLDHYINPKDFIEEQKKKLEALKKDEHLTFPEEPWKDVMGFLLHFAPLENWQRDILDVIRDEALYFAPQGQTKIMNEGWASYWHSKMMTERIMDDSEVIDFADHHSGVTAMGPGRLNPYKIGIELYRHIEDRWNKGKFGKEYDECDDIVEKRKWNKHLGLGREKIFQVRKIYNDVTFIDEFLTPEFCEEYKLFSFDYNRSRKTFEIASREFQMIKTKMLQSLTNFGQPFIEIVDANFANSSKLMLYHRHEGIDLKSDYAKEVLQNIHTLWRRPVLIETKVGDKTKIYSYNGEKHKEFDSKEGI